MKKQILSYLTIAFFSMTILSCGGGDTSKKVIIETDYGNMTVKLYDSTPQHRDNFMKLVNEGFYDDLLFHRVIKGFMVQGGDPDSRGASAEQRLGGGGPGYTIPAEIGSPHFKGTLAAARTPNPEKKSSGSQFYLVQGRKLKDAQLNNFENQKKITYTPEQRKRYMEMGGTPSLDMDYTVFGEVIENIEVIDKIAAVKTNPGDRPAEDVKMKIRAIN